MASAWKKLLWLAGFLPGIVAFANDELPQSCQFTKMAWTNGAAVTREANKTVAAAESSCLQDMIVQGGLAIAQPIYATWDKRGDGGKGVIDYEGPVHEKFKDILKRQIPAQYKLLAAQYLATGMVAIDLVGAADYFTKLAEGETKHLGDCGSSLFSCNSYLGFIMSIAPLAGEVALGLLNQQEATIASQWGNGQKRSVLKDVYLLRIEAMKLTADFYRQSYIRNSGETPRWQGEDKGILTEKIYQAIEELLSFTYVWQPEDVAQLIDRQAQKQFGDTPADYIEEANKLTEATSYDIYHQIALLRGITAYMERLDQSDPRPWLKAQLAKSGDSDHRAALIAAFSTFNDVEEKLPYRHEWTEAMRSLNAQKANAELSHLLTYNDAVISKRDELSKSLFAEYNMGLVGDLEKQLAMRDPLFSPSAFFIMQRLALKMARAAHWSEKMKADEGRKDYQNNFNNAAIDIESDVFYYHCQAEAKVPDYRRAHGFDLEVNLPLHNVDISLEDCLNDDLAGRGSSQDYLAIGALFNQRYIRDQLVKELAIKIGVPLVIGAVLGVAVAWRGGLFAGWVFKQLTATSVGAIIEGNKAIAMLTSFFISGAMKQVTHSFLNAAFFVIALKAVLSLHPDIPFWEESQGIWGNFVKPILMATVVFYLLPYANQFTKYLNGQWAKVLTDKTNLAVAMRLTDRGVNTVAFMSADFAHRLVDKISHPTRPLYSSYSDVASSAYGSAVAAYAFSSKLGQMVMRIGQAHAAVGDVVILPSATRFNPQTTGVLQPAF